MRESDSSLYITVGHSTHASNSPLYDQPNFSNKKGWAPPALWVCQCGVQKQVIY